MSWEMSLERWGLGPFPVRMVHIMKLRILFLDGRQEALSVASRTNSGIGDQEDRLGGRLGKGGTRRRTFVRLLYMCTNNEIRALQKDKPVVVRPSLRQQTICLLSPLGANVYEQCFSCRKISLFFIRILKMPKIYVKTRISCHKTIDFLKIFAYIWSVA